MRFVVCFGFIDLIVVCVAGLLCLMRVWGGLFVVFVLGGLGWMFRCYVVALRAGFGVIDCYVGLVRCCFGFVFAGLLVMIWLLFTLMVVCLIVDVCVGVSGFRLHVGAFPLVVVNDAGGVI